MRTVLSSVAGRSVLIALALLGALVYWSGTACERLIEEHAVAGTLDPAIAETLVAGVWGWHVITGLGALALITGLGVISVRSESRLLAASASLDQTTVELKDLSLARTSFLAMMSHELRTPLNSVIGFSGILASGMAGTLTVEQRKQVGIINSAGRQLLALINDILDLSKLETGKLVLVAEEFPVAEAIESVVDTLRPLAEDRGLEMRVELPDPALRMCTDRRRLEQILLGVISRSVRLTESGHVLAQARVAPDGDVVFTISDTGAGMTADEIAALFDENREIDVRAGRPRSTGFALMVSRRLARALRGDIEVESEPGLGSVFTIRLPEILDEGLCG